MFGLLQSNVLLYSGVGTQTLVAKLGGGVLKLDKVCVCVFWRLGTLFGGWPKGRSKETHFGVPLFEAEVFVVCYFGVD